MTKNKAVFFISFFILIIILITSSILYLDHSKKNTKTAINTSYSGYDNLKNKLTSLSQDKSIVIEPDYGKLVIQFTSLENDKLSEEKKYIALTDADGYLETVYAITNNHKLYDLSTDLTNFAKKNFPKFYKESDFFPTICIDSSCAEQPQPEQILKIVDELKASNIPEQVKGTFVQDILNPGFMNKNQLDNKVFSYIQVSQIFRTSGALTNLGLNKKLSDELNTYLQKTYPIQYKKYAIPTQ